MKKTKGETHSANSKSSSEATVVKAVDTDRRAGKRVKQQKAEKQILTHVDIIYDESNTTEHGKRTAFSKIVLYSGWISAASFTTPHGPGW